MQNRRRVVYYAILLLLILGELLGERNYIIIIFPEYDNGEQRHPIDQLNMGRQSKQSQNQERTHQTESTEQQQVPGPSHATLPDEQLSGDNSTPVPVDENPPNNVDEGELAHLC